MVNSTPKDFLDQILSYIKIDDTTTVNVMGEFSVNAKLQTSILSGGDIETLKAKVAKEQDDSNQNKLQNDS